MDVSDIIEYNANTLTISNLNNSFFCLSRVDPTVGFDFDATRLAGRSFPDASADILGKLQSSALPKPMWRSCNDHWGLIARDKAARCCT